MIDWLAERPETASVQRRAGGDLEVRFRETGLSGSFIRRLRDKLATSRMHRPSVQTDVVHAVDGRVRLRLRGGEEDDPLRLSAWLADQPGVLRASGSVTSASLLICFDPAQTNPERLRATVRACDIERLPAPPPTARPKEWLNTAFNTTVFALSLAEALPLPVIGVAVAATALPSARRALHALEDRRLSVDVLDLAAIGISIGTGQPATAAFITWLLGLGDLILERTADGARAAISKVMDLEVGEAWRYDSSGHLERVSAKVLKPNDRIVVGPGARAAADGVIVRGTASVDEKALTGESLPVTRGPGERLLAASVVLDGEVTVEVERTGQDTTAGRIVQILQGSGAKPMTLQRNIEQMADRLVLPTLAVAAAAAFISGDIGRLTSILITDFGTGIRVSVPTTALVAITLAARQRVLVKGGQYLERMSRADCVVFDKTGTITCGTPDVFEAVAVGSRDARECIALAVAAEERQHHPVAEALRRYAEREGIAAVSNGTADVAYAAGVGLSANVAGHSVLVGGARLMQSKGIALHPAAKQALERQRSASASSLLVAVDGELCVVMGYADTPRPEGRRVVEALGAGDRRRVLIMSGDGSGPAEEIARRVGVRYVLSGLLPQEKLEHVRRLQREGHVVAMVGDGINDAPALAVADVGISLGGATDVALEMADVLLLDGGLAKLPDAFELADGTMRRIHRSLALVVWPNAVAIVLGALGWIGPGAAAMVNNGSTVVAALAGLAPLLSRSELRARRSRPAASHDEGPRAHRVVRGASALTAAIAAVLSPIPLADELVFLPLYGVLAAAIGRAHGLSVRQVPWKPVTLTALSGLFARGGVNVTVAYIPGVAAVANATTAFALTDFFGHYVSEACARPNEARGVSPATLVAMLKERAGTARSRLETVFRAPHPLP